MGFVPPLVTETEQPTEVKSIKAEPNRGKASALVFLGFVPLCCTYITFFWFRNTRQIYLISNYIANNIEKKINILYLQKYDDEMRKIRKNELLIMPLNWETYMSTQIPGVEFLLFILTYGLIAFASILFGLYILYLIGQLNMNIVVIIPVLFYLAVVIWQMNESQSIQSANYIKRMKDRIQLQNFPRGNIAQTTIVAWKRNYVEEFGDLDELAKPLDIIDELTKNPVEVPGIRSITREEMHREVMPKRSSE